MDMLLTDLPKLFSLFDGAVLVLFCTGAVILGWVTEHPPERHPSTHKLMKSYRRDWMLEMAARDVRIFDAQLLATLRQGASFFASTTLIALGGGAALLGQVDRVQDVASELSQDLASPVVVWEIKILFVLLLLAAAFLKFVWAIRVFGYCAVVMAATPNDPTSPQARHHGEQAAELNYLADRSFTRGLRGIYFSLAAMAWLVGPWAFLAATLATIGMIFRREFASRTRALLLEQPGETMPAP